MLKVLAMVTMIIDHVGSHLVDRSIIIFETETYTLTLYRLMRDIGRLAFPLFCFLLIEGYLHTRSKVRYGVSLGVMALISEIPFDLEHYNKLFDLHGQNIFFTLLLGYLAICAVEQWKSSHPILLIPVLIGIMMASHFGLVDYGVFGVAFIVVLYALRQNEFFRLFSAFLSASRSSWCSTPSDKMSSSGCSAPFCSEIRALSCSPSCRCRSTTANAASSRENFSNTPSTRSIRYTSSSSIC